MPADRQLPTGGVSENPNLKSPSWGFLNTVFLMLDACRHFTSEVTICKSSKQSSWWLMPADTSLQRSPSASLQNSLPDGWCLQTLNFKCHLFNWLLEVTYFNLFSILPIKLWYLKQTTSTAAIENISLFKLKSSNQNHHKLWYLEQINLKLRT